MAIRRSGHMTQVDGDRTEIVRLAAPAKLTVSLQVLGRRPDGYHDLAAEMVSLDLSDALVIDPSGDGVEVTGDGARAEAVPAGRDNLVARALAAIGRTARVRLDKRIPVGGGLGGGSADAAAILRWAGCTDLETAASLGADVPFCLVGGRALIGGIGERLTPLPFEPRSFVLLVPPIAVNTAVVYRAWDELSVRGGNGTRAGGDGAEGAPRYGHNELTAAALAVEPRLADWRNELEEATGRTPILAGSGSTWWVEGTPDELGLTSRASLRIEDEVGQLISVRTVPAGWDGSGKLS